MRSAKVEDRERVTANVFRVPLFLCFLPDAHVFALVKSSRSEWAAFRTPKGWHLDSLAASAPGDRSDLGTPLLSFVFLPWALKGSRKTRALGESDVALSGLGDGGF